VTLAMLWRLINFRIIIIIIIIIAAAVVVVVSKSITYPPAGAVEQLTESHKMSRFDESTLISRNTTQWQASEVKRSSRS